MELFKKDKLFKEAIGAFIIASSEMEFAVANLCSIICEDPRLHQKQLFVTMGLPLDKKRTILSEFIKNNMPSLAMEWININDSIGRINADRRYLAHGFTQYFLPGEYIVTYIKNKGQITKKTL